MFNEKLSRLMLACRCFLIFGDKDKVLMNNIMHIMYMDIDTHREIRGEHIFDLSVSIQENPSSTIKEEGEKKKKNLMI